MQVFVKFKEAGIFRVHLRADQGHLILRAGEGCGSESEAEEKTGLHGRSMARAATDCNRRLRMRVDLSSCAP